MVRNESSSRIQFLPKRPRQLRSGCGGIFWPSSAPRICFRGVRTSDPWTINCGMFWRTWHAKKCHNGLEILRRFLLKAAAEIPLEMECEATAEWPEHLKACIKAEGGHFEWHCYKLNLKLLQINYLARKVDVLFNSPSRSHCTCNRTYGKTMCNLNSWHHCQMTHFLTWTLYKSHSDIKRFPWKWAVKGMIMCLCRCQLYLHMLYFVSTNRIVSTES